MTIAEIINDKSTRLPWRVTMDDGVRKIETRYDDLPGTRNNYVIADGIQTDHEAILMASAPEMLKALGGD